MALRDNILDVIECLEKVLDLVEELNPGAADEVKEQLQAAKDKISPFSDACKKRWDNKEARKRQSQIQKERWEYVNSNTPFELVYGGKSETVIGWDRLSKVVGIPVKSLKVRMNKGAGWLELKEELYHMHLKHKTDKPFRTITITKGEKPAWSAKTNG